MLGFLVSLTGNLLLFFPNPAIGGSVFALGLVILGIAALRANTLPPWASGVWVFSPFIAVFGFVFPQFEAPLFLFGALTAGIGFFGVGFRLWQSPEVV